MERGRGGGIGLLSEDLLQNIFSRLPALSFASAACVSRSWRRTAAALLSRPKLASAISLNPSFPDAVNEVFHSVLSSPIRPHFAIAYVGLEFSLNRTHKLITKKLGSIPVITSFASGVIGSDAISRESKEVKWESDLEDFDLPHNDRGLVLTVGFVPGMKVDAIPLLQKLKEPCISFIDKFVMDVKDYSATVSGCTSPTGIVMFGDGRVDLKPILEKMDYAMSMETVILGGQSGGFVYRSMDDSRNFSWSLKDPRDCCAVALVFARDNYKPQGVGETQFHVALSAGLVPIGPTHKAVSVKVKGDGPDLSTWLTARKEGLTEVLDGERILHDIYDEMENENASNNDLFIGVTKRRKCSIGSEKVRWVTTMEFHCISEGNEEYLIVDGVGIKTGDLFRFYHPDPVAALSSCSRVSEEFRNLKQAWTGKNGGDKTAAFGGIVFTCFGRGNSFFGRANVDSSPFLENFPGVPFAGVMCSGEIGRLNSSSAYQQEESSCRSCVHYYSTVYLVMSYTPPLEG